MGAALGMASQDEERVAWSQIRKRLASLVESDAADLTLGCLIAINAVLVVLETDYHGRREPVSGWLTALTTMLLFVYAVELLIRIYVYRQYFFTSNWNVFDFTVVALDVSSQVIERVVSDGIPGLSVLRIFRLGRLLRLVEVLTIFHELHTMVELMIGAFRAMFWGTVLLGIILTLWSIVAVEFIHSVNLEVAATGAYDDCERCARAFESVAQSNLTSLVFGDSWGLIAVGIIERSPWTSVVFVLTGLCIQLGFFNLVLTVIVDKAHDKHESDTARKIIEREIEFQRARDDFVQLCETLDKDSSGDLDFHELIEGFDTNEQFATTLAVMDIKKEDLAVVFDVLDDDQSGGVSYKEFAEQLYKMKSQDSQTMLVFIKSYVNEVRRKVKESHKLLKNDITHKLDSVVEKFLEAHHEKASRLADGGGTHDSSTGMMQKSRSAVLDIAQRSTDTASAKDVSNRFQDMFNNIEERLKEQLDLGVQNLELVRGLASKATDLIVVTGTAPSAGSVQKGGSFQMSAGPSLDVGQSKGMKQPTEVRSDVVGASRSRRLAPKALAEPIAEADERPSWQDPMDRRSHLR